MTYNELAKATAQSGKIQKADRKILREWARSKNGQRAIINESWEKKLQELQEREKKLKAENPKYKKKFKYQLEAEIKELWKSKITFSVDMSKFKQEPKLLYFDIWGEPVYNLAGKEQEAELRAFLKKNRETCEKQKAEAEKRETQERAEYWKKIIEKRKWKALKLANETVNIEYEGKIEELVNGSYKMENGGWKPKKPSRGYFVETGKYNGVLKKNEYLGKWWDEADGKLYIGVSRLIRSREKAIELAKSAKHNYETGEKAIWDCKNQCEIRI